MISPLALGRVLRSGTLNDDLVASMRWREYPPADWNSSLHGVTGHPVPRQIWSYWEQGDLHKASLLNRRCLFGWQEINPHWQHRVLSKSAAYEMVPELQELFDKEPRTIAARSDMVRVSLLAKFGGIWADASLLPVKPLDSFIDHLTPSGFFAFSFDATTATFGKGHVASWFLASTPGNVLVTKWRDAFVKKWTSKKHFAYFELHKTLADLVQSDRNVSLIWDRMPHITERWPHLCIPGCDSYFERTSVEDQAPMLKRPYQRAHHQPPARFWSDYAHAVSRFNVQVLP